MEFKDKNYWAVILGGSSGFGLATAKKLGAQGMNICIVHRDRKGSMSRIQPEFDAIKTGGVELVAYNTNALDPEVQQQVCEDLKGKLGGGKVRVVMHSIAFGNLKLVAPLKEKPQANLDKLASKLGVSVDQVKSAVNELFNEGEAEYHALADYPDYGNNLIEDENISETIYAMGSSMLSWTQYLYERDMFADLAQVLGMTSEGNEVAWRGYAAVSAAKVVLESISRAIALEYAPYGIRSNIIQAGVTDTPALRMIPGSPQLSAKAKLRNPFGKLTKPEYVADAIYLLCKDEAHWINGNVIGVDGGERITG